MIKKYQRKFWQIFFIVTFLFFGFLILSTAKVSAVSAGSIKLEVAYPTISGQTLDATTTLPNYIKYLFDAGMFLCFFAVFLSLIIAGAMYLLSPLKPDMQTDAKDRISGAISGLLILVLVYLIITTINPQLNILNSTKLPPVPPPPKAKKAPGVYFYKANCDSSAISTTAQPYIASAPDLGKLKNALNFVDIQQDTATKDAFITILYKNPNFWGECQYINGNDRCKPIDIKKMPASSASIYKYDPDPNGDGVYFFRKSCFNDQSGSGTSGLIAQCQKDSGGWYEVKNSDIKGIYVKKLEDLKFQDVPKEEQTCNEYDNNGKCTKREIPALYGENISSMVIKGNYLVLFIYAAKSDDLYGPWTSCQEFPTITDVNRLGPQQIKWENIRNSSVEVKDTTASGANKKNSVMPAIPNYVAIIPIKY